MTVTLDDLGWTPRFAEAFAALGLPGAEPARVSLEHTHIYRVLTADGELLARLADAGQARAPAHLSRADRGRRASGPRRRTAAPRRRGARRLSRRRRLGRARDAGRRERRAQSGAHPGRAAARVALLAPRRRQP